MRQCFCIRVDGTAAFRSAAPCLLRKGGDFRAAGCDLRGCADSPGVSDPVWLSNAYGDSTELRHKSSLVLSKCGPRIVARHGRLDAILRPAEQSQRHVPAGASIYSRWYSSWRPQRTFVRRMVRRKKAVMPKADFAKWPMPKDIGRVTVFFWGEDAKVIHGAVVPVFGNS
jgi:hypothetical protein